MRGWCIKRSIPRDVHDDLVQEGYVGLIGAAGAFDPRMGVPFTAYAYPRVIGSVQDGMRRMDPISRRDREKIRNGEFAEPIFLSMDTTAFDSPILARIAAEETEEPLDLSAIWDFVYRLPERLRIVVYLRYAEGKSMEEIGNFFGVGIARASQLHSDAIVRLKKMIGHHSEW